MAIVIVALIGPAVVPRPTEARVVRFVVEQTRTFADGQRFGDAGPYERLDGTVYIEVDPRDPLNAGIINLNKVPKHPKGKVGYASPFFMLAGSLLNVSTARPAIDTDDCMGK